MGSRKAVKAFAQAAKPFGIECEFLPTYSEFSFANGDWDPVYEKCRIWFPTKPPSFTDVDVLNKGAVPILLSLGQMRNLRFTLDMNPYVVLLTCEAFGLHRSPLRMSTTRHLVLDMTELRYSPTPENCFLSSALTAKSQIKTPGCPACEGIHKQGHIPGCPRRTKEITGKEVCSPLPGAPRNIRTVFHFNDGTEAELGSLETVGATEVAGVPGVFYHVSSRRR